MVITPLVEIETKAGEWTGNLHAAYNESEILISEVNI